MVAIEMQIGVNTIFLKLENVPIDTHFSISSPIFVGHDVKVTLGNFDNSYSLAFKITLVFFIFQLILSTNNNNNNNTSMLCKIIFE